MVAATGPSSRITAEKGAQEKSGRSRSAPKDSEINRVWRRYSSEQAPRITVSCTKPSGITWIGTIRLHTSSASARAEELLSLYKEEPQEFKKLYYGYRNQVDPALRAPTDSRSGFVRKTSPIRTATTSGVRRGRTWLTFSTIRSFSDSA